MATLVVNQPTLPSFVCHLVWWDLDDTTARFILLWQDQEFQLGRYFTRVSTSPAPAHPAKQDLGYFSRSCWRDPRTGMCIQQWSRYQHERKLWSEDINAYQLPWKDTGEDMRDRSARHKPTIVKISSSWNEQKLSPVNVFIWFRK